MTEFFDIVDENDRIIGKAHRSECHSNPKLIHRGVFVIVVNKTGDVLLSKRSMKKDTGPGKWEVIGEHNKPGEYYSNAALRGVKEELGLSVKTEKISKIRYTNGDETELDEVFFCRVASIDGIKIDREEIDEVIFLSLDELKKKITCDPEAFTDGTILAIKEYLSYIKRGKHV